MKAICWLIMKWWSGSFSRKLQKPGNELKHHLVPVSKFNSIKPNWQHSFSSIHSLALKSRPNTFPPSASPLKSVSLCIIVHIYTSFLFLGSACFKEERACRVPNAACDLFRPKHLDEKLAISRISLFVILSRQSLIFRCRSISTTELGPSRLPHGSVSPCLLHAFVFC